VKAGNAEVAAFLVGCLTAPKHGPEFNRKFSNTSAFIALADAAELGQTGVVEAIVAQGLDINGNDKVNSDQPDGSLDIIAYEGLGGNRPDYTTNPLIRAARAGKLETVAWLVVHGANIDSQLPSVVLRDYQKQNGIYVFKPTEASGTGNNALSMAVLAERTSVVQLLVKHGADLSRHVTFRSAYTPWLEVFITADPNPSGHYEKHTLQNGMFLQYREDGSVETNVPSVQAESRTIRELMTASKIPEIKALSVSEGK
jgi:hypothetical protein